VPAYFGVPVPCERVDRYGALAGCVFLRPTFPSLPTPLILLQLRRQHTKPPFQQLPHLATWRPGGHLLTCLQRTSLRPFCPITSSHFFPHLDASRHPTTSACTIPYPTCRSMPWKMARYPDRDHGRLPPQADDTRSESAGPSLRLLHFVELSH
jgi:hypothetical protein